MYHDYQCIKCAKVFEAYTPIDKNIRVRCECGSEVQKIIRAPAIHFHGKGFTKSKNI